MWNTTNIYIDNRIGTKSSYYFLFIFSLPLLILVLLFLFVIINNRCDYYLLGGFKFSDQSQANLRVDLVDLLLVHLDHVLPLDLHGGPDLAAGDAEVPRDDHPLLDPLRVADGLLVGRVYARLDPLHHLGVRALEDILDCARVATD